MKILTTILISTISLVVASLLVPSYLALDSFSKEFENTITDDLKILNTNTLDKLSRFMNNRIFEMKMLSSPTNKNLVGSELSIDQKINFLKKVEEIGMVYDSSSLYDINGIKLGDTHNLLIGNNESSKPFFIIAKSGKIFYDEFPVMSESLNVPVLHFSGPTYDENGNINGVVVCRFAISKISEILDKDTIYSKPLNIDLVSHSGNIFYSNHYDHYTLSDKLIHFVEFDNFVSSDEHSVHFFAETHDNPQKESLYIFTKDDGYSFFEGGKWILITEINSDILFAEERDAIINFMIFATIVIVIASILSYVIAKGVSTPLTKLTTASTKIAGSNSREKIIVTGNQEIRQLTFSFNKMIDDLNKIDSQKQEFMSMVSHELKTPLTPIMLYADMLKKGLQGKLSEQQLKSIEHIYTNSTILLHLISDVLDVNKLELKEMILKKEPVEINTILRKSIKELESYTNIKNILVSLEISGSWTIKIDPQRFHQVISNLIKNSVDFVPDYGGKIIIKAERSSQNETLITVSDNGIGIPHKDIEHLFKKFYQIDSSLSRSHGGTGLGLTICQGIVEAHGGKIWYDEDYTPGASFKFSLPNF